MVYYVTQIFLRIVFAGSTNFSVLSSRVALLIPSLCSKRGYDPTTPSKITIQLAARLFRSFFLLIKSEVSSIKYGTLDTIDFN